MKSKKIPRSVIAYLIILGFYIGSLVAPTIYIVIGAIYGTTTGIMVLVIEALGSLCFLLVLGWKYKTTLQQWGIFNITEKVKEELKEKKKK